MQRRYGIPTTIDDIIQATIVQLAKHELLTGGANVLMQGKTSPVRVKKYRDFNGVELKESGLTLSVYPFNYEGTSRPTPESTNTSISFKPYGFTGPNPTRPSNTVDLATANVKVRLDYLDYTLRDLEQTATITGDASTIFGSTAQIQAFETNDAERMLRSYIEYVRLALSTDLFNLNGLIQSSFVTWCNFPTSTWDKAGNLILHTAELMWQVYYYPLREWKVEPGIRGIDPIIGSLQKDGSPVFYNIKHDMLITGYGVVILNTPTGIPVTWNGSTGKLINSKTKENLSDEALLDSNSGKPFIRLDILPIGILSKDDSMLYFNKLSGKIIKYDGTEISKIPGKNAKLTIDKLLDLSDTSSWVDVSWDSKISKLVYGANHPNKGEVVKLSDLIDPSTQDLYLITDHVILLNSSLIREFALF
jgi:hypothetical protein